MKFDCLLFHGSFLTRVVIGSYNTKGDLRHEHDLAQSNDLIGLK